MGGDTGPSVPHTSHLFDGKVDKDTCFRRIFGCFGLWWGLLGSQVYEIASLDPAEVGQDQSRVVGRDTGPSIPHTSHLFDG